MRPGRVHHPARSTWKTNANVGPFSGERTPAQMSDAAALAIQIERPVIATEDGRSFDGYLARPAKGRGPGVMIFSEMWGVAPSKTEMAEDYAKRGWCAYVRSEERRVGKGCRTRW